MILPSGRPVDRSKDKAILLAAREILLRDGASALTMEAVANKAAVSKATLYSRYSNRNELIEAVLRAQSDFFVETLSLGVTNRQQWLAAAEGFSVRLLEYLFSDDHLCLLKTLHGHECMPVELRERMYELGPLATCQQVESFLALSHQAEIIHCPDPEFSAECLFGMLVGMDMLRNVFHQSSKRNPANIPAHVQRVLQQFLRMHERAN
jgi:TetR/AcrR family transcriptional repressor of mexJK operon